MTTQEAFITNLIRIKIPMINSWLDSMNLSINKHAISEDASDMSVELSGYTLGHDINRGYLLYDPESSSYSEKTHYLLGMYLRALKELENLDALSLYNCIISTQALKGKYVYTAPLILNRLYSIYFNSILPIDVQIYNNYTNKPVSKLIHVSCKQSSGPTLLYPTLANNLNEVPSNCEKLIISEANPNLCKSLEFRITTTLNIDIALLEGDYSRSIQIKNTNIFVRNVPYVGAFYSKFSPKLIEFLSDVAITEKSMPEIKQEALLKYPAVSISEAAQIYLKKHGYIYDIDAFIDKRLRI